MFSPLADCTKSAMQTFNKANNGITTKIVAKGSWMPEYSPENMSYYISQTPCSNFSTPFVVANANSPPFSRQQPQKEEDATIDTVNRTLFCNREPRDSTPNTSTEGANLSKPESSPTSIPSKSIGKIYVGGRPRPVLCRHSAEVTVLLRYGDAVFFIPDVYEIFPTEVEIGDLVGLYVIVEGDRGEDMGVISAVNSNRTTTTESGDKAATQQKSVGGNKNNHDAKSSAALPKVLRHANDLDIMRYEYLTQAEEEALTRCRECLEQAELNEPIIIERAIFQYDRKKLTVQFKSDSYVDFNVLTRMLHTHYKCRIWMHQLNRDVRSSSNGVNSHEERRHHGSRRCGRNANNNNDGRRRE